MPKVNERRGEQHHNWKGDAAGYGSLHERVRRARGNADEHTCARCPAQAREWAMIHGTNGTEPQHYTPLCIPCHRAYDDGDTPRGSLGDRNGSKNGRAKFTEPIVLECHQRFADGESVLDLADAYSTPYTRMWKAVTGQTWKKVPMP